jgi:hypothetical protein
MPDVLAQVSLHSTSGLPEDDWVNTFAFSMPSGFESSPTEIANLFGAIEDLYTDTPVGGTRSIMAWLGPDVSRVNLPTVKLYNLTGHLDGTPHGSPFAEDEFSTAVPAFSDITLPHEVAVAITLRGTGWAEAPIETPDGADPGTAVDRPRQRKTGRIFIGPLGDDWVAPGGRPGASGLTDLRLAAANFGAAVKTIASGARWCVWSRVDTFLYTITDVQTDNAFDTQRRRGVAPTTRTTLAIP